VRRIDAFWGRTVSAAVKKQLSEIAELTEAVRALTSVMRQHVDAQEHNRAIMLRVERRLDDTDYLFSRIRGGKSTPVPAPTVPATPDSKRR
jgi:hypothetical protein